MKQKKKKNIKGTIVGDRIVINNDGETMSLNDYNKKIRRENTKKSFDAFNRSRSYGRTIFHIGLGLFAFVFLLMFAVRLFSSVTINDAGRVAESVVLGDDGLYHLNTDNVVMPADTVIDLLSSDKLNYINPKELSWNFSEKNNPIFNSFINSIYNALVVPNVPGAAIKFGSDTNGFMGVAVNVLTFLFSGVVNTCKFLSAFIRFCIGLPI